MRSEIWWLFYSCFLIPSCLFKPLSPKEMCKMLYSCWYELVASWLRPFPGLTMIIIENPKLPSVYIRKANNVWRNSNLHSCCCLLCLYFWTSSASVSLLAFPVDLDTSHSDFSIPVERMRGSVPPPKGEGGSDLRRGPWTREEDNLLIHYIAHNGEGRWNMVAKCAGKVLIALSQSILDVFSLKK